MAPVPRTTKAIWYWVLHDILPTNDSLHNIRLAPWIDAGIVTEKIRINIALLNVETGK